MRITKQQLTLFGRHNRLFNKSASHAVGDLLATEPSSSAPYMSAASSISAKRAVFPHLTPPLLVGDEYPPSTDGPRYEITELGEYERVLFSALVWGEYTTYVLLGQMGTGKSTVAHHILNCIATRRHGVCVECPECKPLLLVIDFNKGYNFKDPEKVVQSFRRRLSASLRQMLRGFLRPRPALEAFVEFATQPQNQDDYAEFDSFLQETEESIFTDLLQPEKINRLFSFIDGSVESLRLLMMVLRFVHRTYRQHPGCLLLLFDNIDRLLPEAQLDILLDILSLQAAAGVRTLVPMRPTTFAKLPSNATYSFGCIPHCGPQPLAVVQRRLDDFLAQPASLKSWEMLSVDHREAFVRRARVLSSQLSTHKNYPVDTIAALSGESVRRSLYMMERVFLNSVVPYDRDPQYGSDVVRALLTDMESGGEMPLTDQLAANVFVDGETGAFSLLNIRILQLLFVLKEHPSERTLRNVYSRLRGMAPWGLPEVLVALNYLLSLRRGLAWVDGKSTYRSVQQMEENNDVLHITELGEGYLRTLAMELTYVQEALMSARWSKDRAAIEAPGTSVGSAISSLPTEVDFNSRTDRFRALRACLRVMMEVDWEQYRRLAHWILGSGRRGWFQLEMVSNRVLYGLSGAVTRLVRAGNPGKREDEEELTEWKNLLELGIDGERRHGDGTSNQALTRRVREIDSALQLIADSKGY
jgi:hypothetical protein